jgi:hypothetical protein
MSSGRLPAVVSVASDRTGTSPVDRPNMLSRSAAKLWAMELGSD